MLCASFHKFFRYLEDPNATLSDNELLESIILEKKDGSLVMPVIINNKIYMKTKKSFDNKHCLLANTMVEDSDSLRGLILNFTKNGFTSIIRINIS